MSESDFTQKLQNLMQRVGIPSFRALSQVAGISKRQIVRLRREGIEQIRIDILLKLSQALQLSLDELVVAFSQESRAKPQEVMIKSEVATPETHSLEHKLAEQELLQQIENLKQEYARLQQQLEQQREQILQEFQQSSLQLLESLLLQLPTITQKVQENPQIPASNIVLLVQKPLEKLLQQWGVEMIAPVGAELPYNPQLHQLLEGNPQPGEIVKIRYTGYRQGEKLLFRAKVSPVN